MSQDSTIDNLLGILKRYLGVRVEHIKLLTTEKLSLILSALVLLAIAILLAVIALCYFSVAVVSLLQACVGMVWACVIMGALMLLLLLLIYLLRKPLVLNPIVRLLAGVLLDDAADGDGAKEPNAGVAGDTTSTHAYDTKQ